jgi:hypothetical protein
MFPDGIASASGTLAARSCRAADLAGGQELARLDCRASRAESFRRPRLGRRDANYAGLERPYQSAWTAVPLCSVATVPFAPHAITADRSGQLSMPSCQCLAMPAGDS